MRTIEPKPGFIIFLLLCLLLPLTAAAEVNIDMGPQSLDKVVPLIIGKPYHSAEPLSAYMSNVSLHSISKYDALTEVLSPYNLTYYVSNGVDYSIVKQPVVSLSIANQPMQLALSQLLGGTQYAFTIKDGADPAIPVFLDVYDVPLQSALTDLVSQHGYSWRREANTFVIYRDKEANYQLSIPFLEQVMDVNNSLERGYTGAQGAGNNNNTAASGGQPGVNSNTGVSSNMTSTSLSSIASGAKVRNISSAMEALRSLLSVDGRLAVFPETGIVWVRDHASIVDMIGRLVDDLNKFSNRMVKIEGVITEVTLDNNNSVGVNWNAVVNEIARGGTQASASLSAASLITNPVFTFNLAWSKETQNLFFNALGHYGDVKVVSKPQLSVANGSIGSLTNGQTTFIVSSAYTSTSSLATSTTSLQTTPLQTGLNFLVMPHILNDKDAVLYIVPDLTNLVSITNVSAGGMTVQTPTFTQKQTQQVIRINNGDTVLISGMMADSVSKIEDGVPVLSSIPLLGALFKTTQDLKQRTELAVMVKVTW